MKVICILDFTHLGTKSVIKEDEICEYILPSKYGNFSPINIDRFYKREFIGIIVHENIGYFITKNDLDSYFISLSEFREKRINSIIYNI